MEIRPFQSEDAPALAELSRHCARAETDFVLNPYWQSEAELLTEFERFGIAPEEHLLVSDAGGGEVNGLVGFLRRPGAPEAGLCAPIVKRGERGHGLGGELLRAARRRAAELGIALLTAGIGVRNRAGYSLLTSLGFRPVRQHWLLRCEAAPESAALEDATLQVEPAAETDADAIHRVYAQCGFEPRGADAMRAALVDGQHDHLVARRDGEVVAFTELETHWPRRVWVAYVGVLPDARNAGLGTALVTRSLAPHFAGGAESAQLLLSPANRTALRAYEKSGFRRHRLFDVLESTDVG